MAGGNWSPTELKVRPGFYTNFVAAALAAIQPGARGIVAIPVKANWGPKQQVVEITDEANLIDTYGTDTGNYTAYNAIRLALLGGAKTVLGYRLTDAGAAKASITLQDTTGTPVNVITLTTKYETARVFKVVVRLNPEDSNKQDIVLLEGTTQLAVFTFTKGTGGVDNAVAAVNVPGNKWVTATKIAVGNGILATIASPGSPLTGGNAGIASITNQMYIDAMTAFEARIFNAFALDGATDSALQASVKSWAERLRGEGKGIIAYMGGATNDDQTPATGNTRSAGFNYEGVVNVAVSGILGGITYSSAMVACYVAGKAVSQSLSESLTYATLAFDDVTPRFTHNQVVTGLQSGTLLLVHDGEKVKVEQGINTLSTLRQGQNNQWKKIKAIRVMDAINQDLSKNAQDNYIGKVINDDDGKVALVTACKNYFDTLVKGRLIGANYTVGLDPYYHGATPLAAPDEVYIKWEGTLVDTMEKIYGTFVVS